MLVASAGRTTEENWLWFNIKLVLLGAVVVLCRFLTGRVRDIEYRGARLWIVTTRCMEKYYAVLKKYLLVALTW
ncbi:MAG: hypothetical protein ACOY81_00245 [Bacillota bacterium]|uniref:hypothetical protein n=1 Tax=Desulfurispora thermophila TaxID=265470 RepID=UPI000365A85A|nr:hypothetical protein [Desulfurispora thermophila]